MTDEGSDGGGARTPVSGGWTVRGGGWVAGQNLLMTATVVACVIWHDQWHSVWTFALGVLLFTMGGILGILGVIHLGRNRTAFPQPLKDGTLVESGVYAAVRHPLYGSVILSSFGWAGIWSSGPGMLLALVLACYMDSKARREERWLREHYPGYAAYARRVKRFVPYVY